jgi:hypothetical protein
MKTDEGDTMRRKAGPLLGLLLALWVTAGCGGGGNGDTGVASAGKPTAGAGASASQGAGSLKDGLLAYAKCMRANGITNFPDPDFKSDGGVSLDMPDGTDSAAAAAAQDKCKSHLPNGGGTDRADPETTKKLLAYAKCMRAGGVTDFPDPAADGHLQLNGNQLDMNDPKYKAADRHCSQYLPKSSGGGPATQTAGGGS